MSREGKNKVVPNLRFPEFLDEQWKETELGAIADLIEERAGSNEYTLMSVTSGVGLVSQKEKFGREIAGAQYKNYYVIKKLDFAYNKSATKLYPEGYIAMLKGVDRAAVPNSIFTCFRVKDTAAVPAFLDYMFHDNFHGKWLRKYIEVGARAHGSLSVDTKALFSLPLALPSPKEQQKIADCLSSLDELITAQSQRLDALKDYKKGLMQQLFPAEGEKVPKLRFAEFRDSGEWEEETLGNLGVLIAGLTYSPEDVRSSGLLVLRSSNVKDGKIVLDDCVYVKPDIKGANLSKANDILICVRNGSKALIGKNVIIPEGMARCTHGAFMTIFRALTPGFVYQLFQTNSFNKQISNDLGATINSINGSNLLKYKFTVPKAKEQQKIASFLSSLDESITSQTEQIEALKTHKKGLMQQLFPTTNAMSANE